MQPGAPPPPQYPQGPPAQYPAPYPPPPAYPYAQPYYGGVPAAATDGKAVIALVLGIISMLGTMCYLGFFIGVPAIIVGALARRDIARSGGAVGGSGMALAGIITGGIGTGISVLYVVFIVAIGVIGSATHSPPVHPPPPVPTVYAPPAPTVPTATATTPTPVPRYVSAHVRTLYASSGPLKTQLANEQRRASVLKEKLLVMTVARWSADAMEILRAMDAWEVQDALEDVIVVQIDVDDFKTELIAARMDRPDVPWFFLIGPGGAPGDAISADEWGTNDAHTIAPVLRKFVRGTLRTRKTPPAPSALPL